MRNDDMIWTHEKNGWEYGGEECVREWIKLWEKGGWEGGRPRKRWTDSGVKCYTLQNKIS